jgi:hypothetical protein
VGLALSTWVGAQARGTYQSRIDYELIHVM